MNYGRLVVAAWSPARCMIGGRRFVVGALVLACPASATAQTAQLDPAKSEAFHQHVAELLGSRGAALPSGDTAVSWTERGPILYFTSRRAGDTLSSAMAREDGLVGRAMATWSGASQTAFHVVWTHGDSVLVDVTGARAGHRLVLRGTRDTAFAVPAMPWVAADYGLEDQQIPLFRALGGHDTLIAVFRPYRMKWDTVAIASRQTGRYVVIDARQGSEVRETYIVDAQDHLLLLRRHDVVMDRRPLEGTLLFAEYQCALVALDFRSP